MSDTDFDDFGGFEAAEPEPISASGGDSLDGVVADSGANLVPASTPSDISNIPWLAASLQSNLAVESTGKGPSLNSEEPSKYDVLSLHSQAEPSLSWPASQDETSASTDLEDKEKVILPSVGINTSTSTIKPSASSSSVSETSQQVIASVQKELAQALEEKHKYRSEVISLKLQNESSVKQLEEVKKQLEKQQESYQSLQTAHEKELQTLKQSNNAAVSIIIQEYKEHNKAAILEVQKTCTELFSKQMSMERDRFQQVFEDQSSQYELWKAETERSNHKTLTESLEAAKADIKKEMEQERETLRLKAESDIKTVQDGFELLKADLVKEMAHQAEQNLAKLESQSKDVMDKVTEELKTLIGVETSRVAEKERSASLDYWEKSSQEMLLKFQTSIQKAVDNQRNSIDAYVQEKLKADQSTQRTQLSAIDVYLEAARQHLKALTNQSES